jgi:hypothetical protein
MHPSCFGSFWWEDFRILISELLDWARVRDQGMVWLVRVLRPRGLHSGIYTGCGNEVCVWGYIVFLSYATYPPRCFKDSHKTLLLCYYVTLYSMHSVAKKRVEVVKICLVFIHNKNAVPTLRQG